MHWMGTVCSPLTPLYLRRTAAHAHHAISPCRTSIRFMYVQLLSVPSAAVCRCTGACCRLFDQLTAFSDCELWGFNGLIVTVTVTLSLSPPRWPDTSCLSVTFPLNLPPSAQSPHLSLTLGHFTFLCHHVT
jgi:hypothetical protein